MNRDKEELKQLKTVGDGEGGKKREEKKRKEKKRKEKKGKEGNEMK